MNKRDHLLHIYNCLSEHPASEDFFFLNGCQAISDFRKISDEVASVELDDTEAELLTSRLKSLHDRIGTILEAPESIQLQNPVTKRYLKLFFDLSNF